ncbi:hypothetical protein A6A04_12155 [Paramagnetospirillum marisnigri]|uniref:Esterase n=1 Tax=Paramagnetospirillum marisnigri TaxID=1285242 RepID=A0A178MYP0_9PROT|nr:hypothetical protein [Paramagnetospirillum marisnigri]OAN54699.1 hypothetical protein A6A04_12155 [Paramagnetospirillum marisnigri]
MRSSAKALVTVVLAALSGCSSVEDRNGLADSIGARAGMARTVVAAERFNLLAYIRAQSPGQSLTVYFEGDGKGWVGGRPPINPTPTDPLALRLAAQDGSGNVAYVARPCQFVDLDREARCDESYWTGRRYAPEVVDAMNRAVDHLKARSRASAVDLVGYSGGGAIAVLVASRRTDVASIRTVAGNLDHVALHANHGVSQMPQSLNAIDVAPALARVPQVHYSGGRDPWVPPFVASRYAVRAGADSCVKSETFSGATHTEGWVEQWRMVVKDRPRCP